MSLKSKTRKSAAKSAAAAKSGAAAIDSVTTPAAPAPAPINPHEIAAMYAESMKLYQEGRECYAKSDELDIKIKDIVGVGGSLVLPNGQVLRVVDNFRDASGAPKLKAFGAAMVSLWSIKVTGK
jgi:hypothetical protein